MTVLTFAEKMPEYKGGEQELMKYLASNIKYPTLENDEDLQFKIYATFVIDTVGKLRNPCILRPKYADRLTQIETEYLRVIEGMPDWNPGMINEKKVPVRFTIPINISWR
jgi:protein TonB